MKAGIRSSEFWLSLCGMLGGLFLSVAPDNIYTQAIGGILATVCGSAYTLGRSWSKGKAGAAEGQARVIADTLLKKKSSD